MIGAFVQRQEHDFDLRWEVPDMDPRPIPSSQGEPGVWQTKQIRVDRDEALFGEVSFDVNDFLTLIGGIRYYEFENSLYGFNGRLSRCDDDNGEPQFPCFDHHPNIDDVSEGDGNTIKLSANFNVGEDKLVYVTYSEGFRAGGVNRADEHAPLPKYDPDYVDNYELGWKTMWLDGRLRFNGAVYHLDWDNFQFSFLDFDLSPLTIIQNIGEADTDGAEFDLVFAATDALTLSLSASYNKAELQEPYYRNYGRGGSRASATRAEGHRDAVRAGAAVHGDRPLRVRSRPLAALRPGRGCLHRRFLEQPRGRSAGKAGRVHDRQPRDRHPGRGMVARPVRR